MTDKPANFDVIYNRLACSRFGTVRLRATERRTRSRLKAAARDGYVLILRADLHKLHADAMREAKQNEYAAFRRSLQREGLLEDADV